VTTKRQFLQGTLEILVLKTLSWGPMHGYGIASWLEGRTAGVLTIEEGSLYPALHRLEARGLVEAAWRLTEKNRRAKYYSLTSTGRRELATEAGAWSAFARAVSEVLDGGEAPVWA
jgi:PadR family transcriptional regulator, regulatory protein PadR